MNLMANRTDRYFRCDYSTMPCLQSPKQRQTWILLQFKPDALMEKCSDMENKQKARPDEMQNYFHRAKIQHLSNWKGSAKG